MTKYEKKIVLDYLNRFYRFNLSTYTTYKLYDKIDKKEVPLKEALQSIKTIFNVNEDELFQVFDDWADEKAIEIQNKVTDLRYKIYEQTGLDLELTTNDLNKMLDSFEIGSE